MPDFRAVVRQLVSGGQYNGKRQHLRGFRTGVPNHDPLVTSTQAEHRISE